MVLGIDAADKAIAANPCLWSIAGKIKLSGGVNFTLQAHEYLGDIMQSSARHIVIRKSAQRGFTTACMLISIHGLIYGLYNNGVIYYFPTDTAAERFSKTHFSAIVEDNPVRIRKYVTDDSLQVKRINGRFLRIFGAKATRSIYGKKDATTVRSEPADLVIRDERDLIDDEMAEQTEDRLLHSSIARQIDLGTPTIPEFGTDRLWSQSDQRLWQIKCSSCGKYTCLEQQFPQCIGYRAGDGRAYRRCVNCGNEIFVKDGVWAASFSGRPIEGYWISQLCGHTADLDKIMRQYLGGKGENMQRFYNSILGMPYMSSDNRLTESDIYQYCSSDCLSLEDAGPCGMGVDVGVNVNHVLIGRRLSQKRYKILYCGQTKGFEELHDLAVRFNVVSCVIDIGAETRAVRDFQASEPYKVFGCRYRERSTKFISCLEDEGIYVVNRTELCDKTHRLILDGFFEFPRRCRAVEQMAHQFTQLVRCIDENAETGDRAYRYRRIGDGQDHYRHSLNYLYLALMNVDFSGGLSYSEDCSDYDDGVSDNNYNVLTYGLRG